MQARQDKFMLEMQAMQDKVLERLSGSLQMAMQSQALPAPPPQDPQAEQPPPPAPKRQAEQAPAPERHRQKLRAAPIPQPLGPSAAAAPPAYGGGPKTAGRPCVLKLDPLEHQHIFEWLHANLPKMVFEVSEERQQENRFLKLTDLQEALLVIPAFDRMTGSRKLGVDSLKRAMFHVFPLSCAGPQKSFDRRIGNRHEKGGHTGFVHYELKWNKVKILTQMSQAGGRTF